MSTVEKDAARGDLRERIVEAARDIVSEQGLDALSMRALAVRIGHSPGTIYLHFQDKDELLRSVMLEGFKRLARSMEREIGKVGTDALPLARFAATGRAYARFALENTGYFRAMFEVPGVAQLETCPEPQERVSEAEEHSFETAAALMQQAAARGEVEVDDPERAAVVGWGLIHGLTSLYVSGHLRDEVTTHEEFMDLVESAIRTLGAGWRPRTNGDGDGRNG
ncbi:MAG: TetR/AcrR family transcriptional regulator [Gemmatimonadota bacterium]|jgi:AcrR family transcriptional regulator